MSETAQGSQRVETVFAESMGRDILKLIVDELRTQPNHWMRMSQEEQGRALERIRATVKQIVRDTSSIIMSTNFTMVAAELDGITIKDGVKINLSMTANDPNRHALYDAKGKSCLLVLADAEQWLERMEDVKAAADQKDWLEEQDRNYDGKQDQPGYRRDQSASAPAGKSWAEIIGKLKGGEIDKAEAEKEYGGELPASDPHPDPLDLKSKDLPADFLWAAGEVHFRSLETDEPDSWGGWKGIPAAQLPELDADETMREALAAIHSPITSEFRYVVAELPELDAPVVDADDPALALKAQAAELHERLFAINMIVPLAEVQKLSPEQRQLANTWLGEYAAWAETPKRKKKDMPKRPHFLPLFEPHTPIDRNAAPPATDGEPQP